MNVVPFGDWSEKDIARHVMSSRKCMGMRERLWYRWLLEGVL